MNPKISIILPSIRPKNLEKWYASAQNACKLNTFEVIIISPYLIPESLMKSGNVTFIHSYANPTISFMQGASQARGEFIYNVTDDGLLQPDVLDWAVNKVFAPKRTLRDNDILNMTYVEDVLDPETLELIKEPKLFPTIYWLAGTYPNYNKPSINPNWILAPHFFMKRACFEALGGLDCSFQYLNYNLHDFLFRAQENGSKAYQAPMACFLCSHLPSRTGDHGPINDAHYENDVPRFNEIYSKGDAVTSRISLSINDWKNYPKIWTRRFPDPNNLPLNP